MRLQNLLSCFRIRAALWVCLGFCLLPAHALYTREPITAYRVADNAFTLDGRPDSLWRTIFSMPNGRQTISFQDYSKMVILEPENARNGNPADYAKNPSAGSISLIAAYDSKALYFFFLIKTAAFANPKALGCASADLWKVDAAEIYLDPSVWRSGSSDYRTYFYTDASGFVYGTSPRTIQVDRPMSSRDSRVFYRNRNIGERFQVRDSLPAGMSVAVSPRTSADTGWVGVEMRIPFWTAASDFAPGLSMFASWGFNRYGDSARTDCNANPIAYRWAKNILNYDFSAEKPPGWRAGDSTHYDPSHSWDGWGQLNLLNQQAINNCKTGDPKATFDANWDPGYWQNGCFPQVTGSRPDRLRSHAAIPASSRPPLRDARGRAGGPHASPAFALPR
jgi:hypothetical protein